MSVMQITTHIEDAKNRLLFQYRGKANIEGLLDSLGGQQIQDLEDILFNVSTILEIDNSIGIQLDNIGKIVGQLRNGQVDSTYKLFLKAKAARNVSEGDIERILSVWKIITGGTDIQITEIFPAEIELFSDVPVPDELAADAFALMQDIVAAGVRVLSSIISPENAFGFENSIGTLGFDSVLSTGQNDSAPWVIRSSAADNNWYGVTYGNGLFVAVAGTGSNNRVMTSSDGETWTIRTSAADNNWRDVTYGNGLFVAVSSDGSGNRVMTSPDGETWTIRTSAADLTWNAVTYGNGLFVAVASSGTGTRVMTSPDGETWILRTSAADNSWQAVTYGNGLFVAVSQNGTGNRVMTSSDGETWTIRASAADNNWYGVTYGGGVFAAIALSGTGNRVMTSLDGIAWTIGVSAADNNWASVASDGNKIVAVAFTGTGNRVMTWVSSTAFKLIDLGATFISDGVVATNEAISVAANLSAIILSVDSENQLTLDTDIFTSAPLDYDVINGGGGGLSKVQSA